MTTKILTEEDKFKFNVSSSLPRIIRVKGVYFRLTSGMIAGHNSYRITYGDWDMSKKHYLWSTVLLDLICDDSKKCISWVHQALDYIDYEWQSAIPISIGALAEKELSKECYANLTEVSLELNNKTVITPKDSLMLTFLIHSSKNIECHPFKDRFKRKIKDEELKKFISKTLEKYQQLGLGKAP